MTPRFTATFRHAFRRLSKQDQARLATAIEQFATAGRGDVRPLSGRPGHSRLRLGKWRAFFHQAAPDVIEFFDVDNRGQAY